MNSIKQKAYLFNNTIGKFFIYVNYLPLVLPWRIFVLTKKTISLVSNSIVSFTNSFDELINFLKFIGVVSSKSQRNPLVLSCISTPIIGKIPHPFSNSNFGALEYWVIPGMMHVPKLSLSRRRMDRLRCCVQYFSENL